MITVNFYTNINIIKDIYMIIIFLGVTLKKYKEAH